MKTNFSSIILRISIEANSMTFYKSIFEFMYSLRVLSFSKLVLPPVLVQRECFKVICVEGEEGKDGRL